MRSPAAVIRRAHDALRGVGFLPQELGIAEGQKKKDVRKSQANAFRASGSGPRAARRC